MAPQLRQHQPQCADELRARADSCIETSPFRSLRRGGGGAGRRRPARPPLCDPPRPRHKTATLQGVRAHGPRRRRQQQDLPLGRSARSCVAPLRRGADDRGGGPGLCAGQAPAARGQRLRRGAVRPRDHDRDGRPGVPGPDPAGGIRLRRGEPRRLRPDRPGDRGGRQRLSLGHERAVVPGHVSDPRLRLGGAAAAVAAGHGQGRDRRLLWPHRGRRRLRSGLHAHGGQARGRRLRPQRRQDVDHQRADRRRGPGVGQAGRRDPRLSGRARRRKASTTPKIENKLSLRASVTGEISLADVFVPKTPCCRT